MEIYLFIGCIGGRTCQSQGAGETLEEAACRGYRPGRDKSVGFIAVLKRSASKKYFKTI